MRLAGGSGVLTPANEEQEAVAPPQQEQPPRKGKPFVQRIHRVPPDPPTQHRVVPFPGVTVAPEAVAPIRSVTAERLKALEERIHDLETMYWKTFGELPWPA